MLRLHSVAAIDRPETTKLPPIPDVVWQQPRETHLTIIHKTSTIETHKNSHKPEFTKRNDVESQRSPMKETSPPVFGSNTESLLENQTRSTPLQSPNDSKKQQHEIQRNQTDKTTYDNGYDNIFPPKEQLHKLKDDLWAMILPMNSTCHYPPQLS